MMNLTKTISKNSYTLILVIICIVLLLAVLQSRNTGFQDNSNTTFSLNNKKATSIPKLCLDDLCITEDNLKEWKHHPIIPKYKEIGPYKDTKYRALRSGPHRRSYNVDTCSNACKDYKYFALQDGNWCSCENDLNHATKYGPRYCGKNGGGYCNYIYENINID